jgi:PEP-CTERM motif
MRRGMWLFAAAAYLLAAPALALTVPISPSSPGLDQGFGYSGCPSCTIAYTLSAAAPVGGGSIQFTNNLAAVEVVQLSITSVSPVFVSGPNSVTFTSMSYSASVNAMVMSLGGGDFLVQQTGFATGTVTGSYSATAGGSGPINLASVDVNSLMCIVNAAGTGVCGVSFGRNGFPVAVGSGSLLFQHTFNVNVPEPATLAMLSAGAVGLALMGRRRTR